MSVLGHGVEICTSTTRPMPISGSLIYETDTQKMMLWDGSSWVTPMNLQDAGGSLTGTYPNPTLGDSVVNYNNLIAQAGINGASTTYSTAYYRGSGYGNADISGFSVNITPRRTTSKILILCTIVGYFICDGVMYVRRGGTYKDYFITSPRTNFQYDPPQWTNFWWDAPSTTSTITYQVGGRATGCAGQIWVNNSDGGSTGAYSTITALEIV